MVCLLWANPVLFVNLSGCDYGKVTDFANDLCKEIYGDKPKYIYSQTGVNIRVGGGYFVKSGDFFYNGDVRMPQNGGRSYYTEKMLEKMKAEHYIWIGRIFTIL